MERSYDVSHGERLLADAGGEGTMQCALLRCCLTNTFFPHMQPAYVILRIVPNCILTGVLFCWDGADIWKCGHLTMTKFVDCHVAYVFFNHSFLHMFPTHLFFHMHSTRLESAFCLWDMHSAGSDGCGKRGLCHLWIGVWQNMCPSVGVFWRHTMVTVVHSIDHA